MPRAVWGEWPKGKSARQITRSSIRSLRPGEPWPEGEPRRYLNAEGYTRLRWKVGPGQHVETYLRDESGALVRNQPNRLKTVDRARALVLFDDGLTTVQIARELGCNPATVSRLVRREGRLGRTKRDYAPEVDKEDLLRRYQANQGYSRIAKDLGVGTGRVKQTLIDMGVELRPVGRVKGVKQGRRLPMSYETEFQVVSVLVHERSGETCEAQVSAKCSGKGTHVHHRKLRSQGGKNDLATLLDCCIYCHTWLHGNVQEAHDLGLLVWSWEDPADVPIKRKEAA